MKPSILITFGWLLASAPVTTAFAGSISNIGLLPGDTGSLAYGTDANGDVVVGESDGASLSGGAQAFVWTAGGAIGLGALAGDNASAANGVSGDGNVVVGISDGTSLSGGSQAFRWTQGGMVGLGALAGDNASTAAAADGDGNVVVGTSMGTSMPGGTQAFRWTQSGMVGLGTIAGSNGSFGEAVSSDGSVVTGYTTGATAEAFRWTQGAGMVGLAPLAGDTSSFSFGVSGDGRIVIGESDGTSLSGGAQAVYWTPSNAVVALGTLPGDTLSGANAANADGSVIVGTSGVDPNDPSTFHAFRWTQATGMQSVAGLLSADGVNLSGWALNKADGVSANGNTVVGYGTIGGQQTAFIADLSTGGVTTPQALVSSLDSAANSSSSITLNTMTMGLSQAMSAAGQGFGAVGEESGISAGDQPYSRWSAYAVGSLGLRQDNQSGAYGLNGTTGVTADVTDDLSVGAGVIGSNARNELEDNGHASLNAAGGSAVASYARPEGLRLAGAGFAAYLDQDEHRQYMNGAGISGSHGDTHGMGYGLAGQAGWRFALPDQSSITPYAELDWSKATLDAYAETGGAFPAAFGDVDEHRTVSRLGATLAHALTPALTVTTGAAWGHRLSGEGGGLTATAEGLTASSGADAGDRDWAEGSLGLAWRVTDATSIGATIAAHIGQTPDPQETATISIRTRFR